MHSTVDAIRARLEAISEDLADLALASLRARARAGSNGTEPTDTTGAGELDERRITRARRAVDKAMMLLGPVDQDLDW